MPDSWARPAGKVCWQVAELQGQDLARCVLWGLSSHMPVSVPALGLQMGHGGVVPRAEVALVLEEGGRCPPRECFLESETEGWGRPGAFPLPPIYAQVPGSEPAAQCHSPPLLKLPVHARQLSLSLV